MRRPEDFKHSSVQLDDVRIHYVREGSGPPLVLLHGWPGFWWEWRKVIGPLAESYDVIVPDLRGFGDSEKTDLDDVSKYSADVLMNDQGEFLDALGLSQVYLVGHDWGGIVAHKFLRKHPERVVKAAIFNPITPNYGASSGEYVEEDWYFLFHQLDMALKLVSLNRESRRLYYKHFLDHWSYQAPLLTEDELEIFVDNYMKPGNVHGGFNVDRANFAPDSKSWTELDMASSDLPVTMLWGVADPVVPPAVADIEKFYSNYTMELVDDCGHFMMLERPDLVIDRIKRDFH